MHEVDLVELLEEGTESDLRTSPRFSRHARSVWVSMVVRFSTELSKDSSLHAVEVTSRLEQAVFAAVPLIAEGLLRGEPRSRENLDVAFANALVFLYRVLFALFAEARELLPVHNADYRDYSVTSFRIEVC